MDSKYCSHCGKRFQRPQNVRGERWRSRQFCTAKCQRLALIQFNTNRPKPFSLEVRKKIAFNIKRYISSETRKKRKKRLQKSYETRKNGVGWISPLKGKIGNNNPNWLGEKAKYSAKHRWIRNHWEKTGICEHCGKKKPPKPGGRLKHHNHWANISKKYLRQREDWLELCSSCHHKFDKL